MKAGAPVPRTVDDPATALAETVPPPPAGDEPDPRRWIVFAVVGVAFLTISMHGTSIATALTSLQHDLGTTLAWAGWTITVYSVGQILALPLAGGIGDRFGPRRVFLTSIAVFTVMSLLCGLTANLGQLIVCRFLQGLAAGALMPSAMGIVADRFGRDRDRALALFSSVFPIGVIIGPLLGALILTVWSWRGIFLVNLPIGVLLILLGALLVRELPRKQPEPVDLGGIALLVLILVPAMLAITGIDSVGDGWLGVLGVVVPGVVSAVALVRFVRHAGRHPHPVVPLKLLTGKYLGPVNITNVMFGAAVIGFSALAPHFAQVRYDMAPLAAGALLTARAVGMICTSGFAVGLLRRVGHRPLLLLGMGLVALGLVLTAVPPVGLRPELWLLVSSAVIGMGTGLGSPAANNAGMHLVPDQAAAVTGLRMMFRQTGAILAIAVITAVASASSDPGLATAVGFVVLAGLMALAFVIAARVPNQRGRW